MNKQGKGKISWTDFTWNPIKGSCPVGCWFCYARAMYKRFHKNWPPDKLYYPSFYESPKMPLKPSKIFVCSTMEIFHPAIPTDWRDRVFKIIENSPQHTFQILTKMPENIDRPMPDNVWLGCSVTTQGDAAQRIPKILQAEARVRFVSIEPLLSSVYLHGTYYDYLGGWDVYPEHDDMCDGSCVNCPVPVQFETSKLNWVIIGRLTGHGHKHDPQLEWIKRIVDDCRSHNTPVFLKHNLKDIWPGELIQEFPE